MDKRNLLKSPCKHPYFQWIPETRLFCTICREPPPKISKINASNDLINEPRQEVIETEAAEDPVGPVVVIDSISLEQLQKSIEITHSDDPIFEDSQPNDVSESSQLPTKASTLAPAPNPWTLQLISNSNFINNSFSEKEKAYENCFPDSWPDDIQLAIEKGLKLEDNMRNEMARKIVRRMEDCGLKDESDYVEVAEPAIRKLPILQLRTVSGTDALITQMKRGHKNHLQYLNRSKKKRASEVKHKKSHEELVTLMLEEMEKERPSVTILKPLLMECRKRRQEDARKACNATEHLKVYPALKLNQLLYAEFEALVGVNVSELRNRWITALPALLSYFLPDLEASNDRTYNQQTVLVLLAVCRHFKPKFGQEKRTRHIIEIFKVSTYIDGRAVSSDDPVEGLIYLHALYWVFNVAYSPEAKVAFTFISSIMLQKKFEKSYKKLKTVVSVLESLNLF